MFRPAKNTTFHMSQVDTNFRDKSVYRKSFEHHVTTGVMKCLIVVGGGSYHKYITQTNIPFPIQYIHTYLSINMVKLDELIKDQIN